MLDAHGIGYTIFPALTTICRLSPAAPAISGSKAGEHVQAHIPPLSRWLTTQIRDRYGPCPGQRPRGLQVSTWDQCMGEGLCLPQPMLGTTRCNVGALPSTIVLGISHQHKADVVSPNPRRGRPVRFWVGMPKNTVAHPKAWRRGHSDETPKSDILRFDGSLCGV